MSLRETLSNYWHAFQQERFPRLEMEFAPLSERHERFVTVVEIVRLESFVPASGSLPERPSQDRAALARAFMAKAVFDIPTMRALIERLRFDRTLYRLCGFGSAFPSAATFSRGFAEFAAGALASRLHETLRLLTSRYVTVSCCYPTNAITGSFAKVTPVNRQIAQPGVDSETIAVNAAHRYPCDEGTDTAAWRSRLSLHRPDEPAPGRRH